MKKNTITLTVIANMTANYGEGLGNIGSIQKIFRNGRIYAIRSKESIKNAIMTQSSLYDDLQTEFNGVTQKLVSEELNVSNCRALEGGYMSTKGTTYIRKSSFYVTDAIACDSFVNETRFHNNLYLATNYAENHDMNVQNDAGKIGLMPYQYEYDKTHKAYSITIDLDMIGKDNNFSVEASKEEKADRVIALLDAVEHLNTVVKGNLDNAEPVFIIGGFSQYRTHYFENVVNEKNGSLKISEELQLKLEEGYAAGLLKGGIFANEEEIVRLLKPLNIKNFFKELKTKVMAYYEV